MRELLPFQLCLLVAAVGLFLLHGTPWQAPVLIGSLACLGLLFIVRREAFARASVRQHDSFWGGPLGQRSERATRRIAVLLGVLFLTLAAVSLAQVTRVQP
jgi:hypothetical protein